MGKRILIVDGALYNRLILRDILVSHGYSVGEASTNEQGLEMYRHSRPDLVALEATTGAARDFRTLDPTSMILMCGSRGQRRLMTQGMTDGAEGIVFRPYSERQVVRAIRRVM